MTDTAKPNDSAAGAAKPQPQQGDSNAAAKPPVAPVKWFVVDTTAVPGGPPRTHELIIEGAKKAFTFLPGVPLELTIPVAIKFLKTEAFKRSDKDGNIQDYARQPKQPHELGAGERFVLAPGTTIARLEELSNVALLQRCLELPNGESQANTDLEPKERRAAMIKFISDVTEEQRKANLARESDMGKDDFVPVAEVDEEAA